jgi:hypothetical protein
MNRGLAVGFVTVTYVVGSILTAPITRHALTATGLAFSALAGIVGAITVGALAQRLRLPLAQRLVTLALVVYLLSTLTNEVEAVLFIKSSTSLVPVSGAILALVLAVPVTALWPPSDTGLRVGAALHATLASRRWWSWLWRIVVASVVWVPVYLVFAAADAPFVHIYYHETNTTFTVPSNQVLFGAELGRGVLHALVLGALAALLALSRRRTWWWLTLTFATLNAWIPLIQRTDWPYYLRAANIVEITCDAVVYGGLVVLLLTRRHNPRPRSDR